jgi:hypothetical protein
MAAQLTGWFVKFIADSDFIKTTPLKLCGYYILFSENLFH